MTQFISCIQSMLFCWLLCVPWIGPLLPLHLLLETMTMESPAQTTNVCSIQWQQVKLSVCPRTYWPSLVLPIDIKPQSHCQEKCTCSQTITSEIIHHFSYFCLTWAAACSSETFINTFVFWQDDASSVLHGAALCPETAGGLALVPGSSSHQHILPWKRGMEVHRGFCQNHWQGLTVSMFKIVP